MAKPPLTDSDFKELIAAAPEGVMIGGMALSFWATYFGVEPPTALAAGVTSDIDFFGNRTQATAFAERLRYTVTSGAIEVLTPSPGDATPNTVKILVRDFHDRVDPLEIDYLGAVIGFTHITEERLRNRAATVRVDEVALQVMDPVDCLVSRVANIRLPEKRNNPGSFAQIRLSIAVAARFVAELHQSSVNRGERSEALKAIEEIADLAVTQPALDIYYLHGIELLDAVPMAEVDIPEFREKRWVQIVERVRDKRRRAKRAYPDSVPPST